MRWRAMFGVAVVPSVLLALGMAFSPESPGWLYQQGRTSHAEASIKRLFGKERVAEVLKIWMQQDKVPLNRKLAGLIFSASATGKAASLLLLSLSFTWKALATYSGTVLCLGLFCNYVLSFSLGAGPVPALLLPEIFASRIRAKAVALSLGMHWISNFVIGLYFLSVVNKFGSSIVYLGFASVCLLAVMYIAGNVVETKGRPLEEIERALSPAI